MIAAILPLVLLFWPFAEWNDVMCLILRVISSIAAQALLCRICRLRIVQSAPAWLTGALAAWGTYLSFTSPHWSNVTAGGLIADYFSPFISCIVVLLAYRLTKKVGAE